MPKPSKKDVSSVARTAPKGVGGLAVYLLALGKSMPTKKPDFFARKAEEKTARIADSNAKIRAIHRANAAARHERLYGPTPTLRERLTALVTPFRRPVAIQAPASVAVVAPVMSLPTAAEVDAEYRELQESMRNSIRRRREAGRFADVARQVAQDERVRGLMDGLAIDELTQPAPKTAQDRRISAMLAQESALAAFDRAARGGR
jgi:hypothetical protein